MAYAILRVKKLKSAGAISAVGQHNARERETLNADPAVANRVLIAGPSMGAVSSTAGEPGTSSSIHGPIAVDALSAVRARIEQSEARIRKNGVLACEVFLGASPEYFRPEGGPAGTWDERRLAEWAPASMRWLIDEWGRDNVVSAVLHLDETTPHIQAIVVPIDPDSGRMNAARWLDGRQALSGLQDRYAEAVSSLGLQRGVRGSAAAHTEIREWYGHLQQAVPRIPEPEVQVPGVLLRERPREEFAQQETARLQAAQRTAVETLESQAREREIAVAQRRDAEATNRRLASELLQERTERSRRETEVGRELSELRVERDALRQRLDVLRQVSLSEAAGWFDPEELAGAGVRIGHDGAGRERIFDAAGNVVGRNPIDLAKAVHGCQTAGEAAAWIEVRQGGQAADRALLTSSSWPALAAEAVPQRSVVESPRQAFRPQRFQHARRQVIRRKPPTWPGVQGIFSRMRLSIDRTWGPSGASYQITDRLFSLPSQPFDPHRAVSPASPTHDLFSQILRELEVKEVEARFRREREASEEQARARRGLRR